VTSQNPQVIDLYRLDAFVRIPPSPPNKKGLSFRPFLFGGAGCVDEPTGFDKNREAIFGRRGSAAAVRSAAEDERPSPAASVSVRHRSSGRPAARNDDGFAQCSPIFLLADRIHRPHLRQQLVDQRTQPRPRRAVRE
jgi:hypothetical protein